MLSGQRLNGIGDWQTVDQQQAMVSYLRLGSLPLGVVVERVISRDAGLAWERIAGEALACFGVLAILIGLEVWALTRGKTAAIPAAAAAEIAAAAEPQAEIPTVQISDDRLDQAIEVHTQVSQAQMEERFLISQFENEAPQIKDTRKLAVKLTLATSRIFRSPALFFGYQEGIQAAVLEAHAGFNDENKPAGMSCPIPETVLRKIFEREQQGFLVSLTDYGPLATLLNARDFEAWAVTGFAPEVTPNGGGPRLLGILAILDRPNASQAPQASLTRLMKATGISYENALLS